MQIRAWVVGAAGFLGRHVARAFSREGWEVAGIGREEFAEFGSWGLQDWVRNEISRPGLDRLLDLCGPPNLIFHAAGSSTVSAAERDPATARDDTVGTARTVLDFMASGSPKCVFLYPSSCAVYGQARSGPISEEAPIGPISRYGEYKAEVEDLCREAATRSGLIRFFSLYGAGLEKQLLWEIAKMARNKKRVDLGGTGDETRDFLHVEDASALVVDVGAHLIADPEISELTVNGGSGVATSVATVAETLVADLPDQAPVTFTGESRPGDPEHLQASIDRARSIGFAPHWSVKEGIADYAKWVSERLWT